MNLVPSAKTRPLTSAIIATYNRAYIVCEAIESILNQTYKNLEIIVVDDGSTDDTQNKLKRYGDRIRVVYQQNSGPAAAWNRGIQESRGEIITFLGSDDIWLPTFVERQVSVLQRVGEDVPCCLCNSWMRFANGRGTTSFQYSLLNPAYQEGIWLNVAEIYATRFVQFGQSVAIRRTALQRTGVFDESLWLQEDCDLALKLSIQGPWGFVREPLVVWRQGTTDSLSQRATVERVQPKENIVRIRTRVLETLNGAKFKRVRSLLQQELRQDRQELWAARMCEEGHWAKLIGDAVIFAWRCENYLYRRSGHYPKMETSEIRGTE
jgi:glycosyltransferase involved in cell wall biosynthesis